MSTRFLSSGGSLQDGTQDINVRTIRCSTMLPSLPVKTDISGVMVSQLLDISDVNGLQAALNGFVTNPLQPSVAFDVNGNTIINLTNLNATGQIIINTPSGGGGVRFNGSSLISGYNSCIDVQDTITTDNIFSVAGIATPGSVITPLVTSAGNLAVTAGGSLLMNGAGGDVQIGGGANHSFYNGRNIASRSYLATLGLSYSPIGGGAPVTVLPPGSPSSVSFPANALVVGDTIHFRISGTFTQTMQTTWFTNVYSGPIGNSLYFSTSSELTGAGAGSKGYTLEIISSITQPAFFPAPAVAQTLCIFTQTDIGTGVVKTTRSSFSGGFDLTVINTMDVRMSTAPDFAATLTVDYANCMVY